MARNGERDVFVRDAHREEEAARQRRVRRKALRDAVYAQMCERAKLSDTEVIKYIKRVGSAEST